MLDYLPECINILIFSTKGYYSCRFLSYWVMSMIYVNKSGAIKIVDEPNDLYSDIPEETMDLLDEQA